MDGFSISQLEQFSGIKAHTIRIWEQRYQALTPHRSEGNTRSYDGSQLRRLLNIVSLMDKEYKVSELCSMSDERLFRILDDQLKQMPVDEHSEYFISQLISAGMNYDEVHFEKVFANCILRMGMGKMYPEVIYPLLTRVGLMWANDTLSPAYEHFISNIIRQKIFSAIDALPPVKTSRNAWLLFLPENEFHEMGLLFSHYLIRQAGRKVFYLGSNVPVDILRQVVEDTKPSHLLLFMVHYDNPIFSQAYLNTLKSTFPKTKIHVSGNDKLIGQLMMPKEVDWIQSVEDLENKLMQR